MANPYDLWGDVTVVSKDSNPKHSACVKIFTKIIAVTDTQVTVEAKTYYWSSYNSYDPVYNYYFDWESANATTKYSAPAFEVTVEDSLWDEANQVHLLTHTKTYNRGTEDITYSCALKVNNVGFTENKDMTHTTTYTIPALETYTITYDGNGAHSIYNVDNEKITSQTGSYDEIIELAGGAYRDNETHTWGEITLCGADFEDPSDSDIYFTATIQYELKHWQEFDSDGNATGNTYGTGEDYTLTSNVTMKAIWNERVVETETVTLPEPPAKEGKVFAGWYDNSECSGEPVSMSYTPTGTSNVILLYAKWETATKELYTKVNGEWKNGPAYVKVNGVWKQAVNIFKRIDGEWKHQI